MTIAISSRFTGPISSPSEQQTEAASQHRATGADEGASGISSSAVELTLSPEAHAALERLRSFSDETGIFESLGEEYMNNERELHDIRLSLWKRERAASQLQSLKERYSSLQAAEPKPAVELTGKAKEAALELAQKLGHKPWGDNYAFGHDGMIYSFRSDGTVWVNDGDVPTSAEAKQQVLSGLSKLISEMESDMRFDVDAAIERRDALLARQDEIRSSWTVLSEA
jgi:hypothetical protein